jgi:hypothetical protein
MPSAAQAEHRLPPFYFAPSPSRGVLWTKASVLTTGVLNGFPLFECSFDSQKIFMFAVIGMLFDGSASPSKSSTACQANGIFRENFGQRIRELMIKCRNVGAASHAITLWPLVSSLVRLRYSLPFFTGWIALVIGGVDRSDRGFIGTGGGAGGRGGRGLGLEGLAVLTADLCIATSASRLDRECSGSRALL